MKKFALLIGIVILSMSVYAQNKGDKYIAPSLAVSFGKQYATYTTSYEAYHASKPYDLSITPSCEFGFFTYDNFRLGLCIGVPFSAYPASQHNDEETWDFDYTLGVAINPNMAYYVRLAEKLYYTPEIGFMFQLWNDFEDIEEIFEPNLYRSFSVYINLFDLEFRVNEKIAIGVGLGSFYYTHAKELGGKLSNSLWYFNFNNAMASVKFYL